MSFLGRSSSEDAQSSSRRNRLSVATARSSQCPVVLLEHSRHGCRCGCFRGLLVTMLRHGATQRRAVPWPSRPGGSDTYRACSTRPLPAWTGNLMECRECSRPGGEDVGRLGALSWPVPPKGLSGAGTPAVRERPRRRSRSSSAARRSRRPTSGPRTTETGKHPDAQDEVRARAFARGVVERVR